MGKFLVVLILTFFSLSSGIYAQNTQDVLPADNQSETANGVKPEDNPVKPKWTPFQLVLWDPVQIVSRHGDVYGIRLDLVFGVNRNVYGMDMGLANRAMTFYGIQTGLFYNGINGDMTGIQTAFCTNHVGGNVKGIQTAFLIINEVKGGLTGIQTGIMNEVSGNVKGIQTGLIYNKAETSMAGIQIAGLINITDCINGWQTACANIQRYKNRETVSNGLQLGIINYSERIAGVQIGVVNWARSMEGVQIGIVNIISNNPVPVLPLFNASRSL